MFTFDQHTNTALAPVTVAPSPATSGTTISVSNANAAMFPTPTGTGYNLVVFPTNTNPTQLNSEIVRLTAKGAADSGGAGNTQFTITRIQESSSARSIIVTDNIMIGSTAKVFTDIETYPGGYAVNATPTANNIPVLDANAKLPKLTISDLWLWTQVFS
jgi:hypothetical protein